MGQGGGGFGIVRPGFLRHREFYKPPDLQCLFQHWEVLFRNKCRSLAPAADSWAEGAEEDWWFS